VSKTFDPAAYKIGAAYKRGRAALVEAGECAAYLGVSTSHLEHLRCSGHGPPHYKIGRLVRYIPDKVDAWAESRLASSTSEASR
jgi:predicted DNA-binding transcriptional regulator AlpA